MGNKRGNDQRNGQQRDQKTAPSKSVVAFATWKFKKYRKKMEDDDFCSKKESKKNFKSWKLETLPDVIEFLYRFGHLQNNREIRDQLYEKLMDEEMIRAIRKSLEKEYGEIDNIEVFPVIAYDIIRTAEMWNQEMKKENPDHEGFDLDDIIELVKQINKKKIKKLVKKGFSEDLAFDLMCVFPVQDLIRPRSAGTMFRVKQIFQIIYAHSKETKIDIDKLFATIFKKQQIPMVVSFAMLERKEKYINFTDTQKETFNAISVWVFRNLENMDKEDIMLALREYFNVRKRDKAKNQDSARRFFLGSLPEDEYPRITSVVNKMKQNDSSIEEFL